MDEKVKAVKKSAEVLQPPLKFAKLPLLPSVGALGHAEFRSFRFRDLRDADFFKAGGPWIREVRRSSSLSAQLYTVFIVPLPIPHPSHGERFGHGLNAALDRNSLESSEAIRKLQTVYS